MWQCDGAGDESTAELCVVAAFELGALESPLPWRPPPTHSIGAHPPRFEGPPPPTWKPQPPSTGEPPHRSIGVVTMISSPRQHWRPQALERCRTSLDAGDAGYGAWALKLAAPGRHLMPGVRVPRCRLAIAQPHLGEEHGGTVTCVQVSWMVGSGWLVHNQRWCQQQTTLGCPGPRLGVYTYLSMSGCGKRENLRPSTSFCTPLHPPVSS